MVSRFLACLQIALIIIIRLPTRVSLALCDIIIIKTIENFKPQTEFGT